MQWTDAQRAKASAAAKKRWEDPQQHARLRKAVMQRWAKPEERRKASVAASRRKRGPCVWEHWQDFVKVAENGCMEWQLSRDGKGYGVLVFKGKHYPAQRLIYMLTNGLQELDPKIGVLHRCDNPPCVNPAHLFLGSQQDNLADMVAKGRKYTKVSSADVVDMRNMYRSGASCLAISKRFHLSDVQTTCIVTGRNWAHIPGACVLRHDLTGACVPKLNVAKARAIRRKFNGMSGKYLMKKCEVLAEEYDVSSGTIRNIILRLTWKEVA